MKIRNWLYYRKCKEWKKRDGLSCYVCTAFGCFRNRFKDVLKGENGK